MNTIELSTFEAWKSKSPSETFEFFEVFTTGESAIDKICRTITSFLNTSGGMIVVAASHGVLSHELRDRVLLEIDHQIAPRPQVEVALVSVEVHRSSIEERLALVIDVPVGYERPYSYKSHILLRKASSTQQANRQEILRLIGEHEDPEFRWERQPVVGATETDLDTERIYESLKRQEIDVVIKGLGFSRDESPLWAHLQYFNLARRPILRNSALILFGKKPTQFFPQAAIRAVAYETRESEAEEIRDEKTFVRNLFANIEDCQRFLERHVSFGSRFPSDRQRSFQRSRKGRYPFAAIREAVLNALVHRNFSTFDTLVSIKITPSQIEIWNPGAFPKGTDLNKLEDFRVSRPTNPDIAHVLQRAGFIEGLGSGINRIIKLFEANGLPRPKWEEVGGGVRVTLSLIPESKNQIQISAETLISKLDDGETLSQKRLAAIGNLSSSEAVAVIEYLCEKGTLRRTEDDKYSVRL